jgi:hypothetical protein
MRQEKELEEGIQGVRYILHGRNKMRDGLMLDV